MDKGLIKIAAFVISLWAVPAVATPMLTAGDLRPAQSLDGAWHYSVDPYRDGEAGFHGGEPGPSSRRYADLDVEAAMKADPTALFEYDMDQSPTATLPSSWLTHAPEMRYYQGLVWYERKFDAQPKPGMRQFLRFGAVNYRATVWLNGRKVGAHEGGFTPFALEVTGVVRAGQNRLVVAADSASSDTTLPPSVTDWENYGGITRSVRLVETPTTYVDDLWVRLTRDGRITADAQLNGPASANQAVTVRIPELNVTIGGKSDAAGKWSGSVGVPSRLRLWSPETPKLYAVTASSGSDAITDQIGFRTIAVKGAQILLNGKPIYLRGISVHEEEIGANPGRNITPEAAHDLLAVVKDGLHGNYVRLAHYPHSEVMTREADKIGLLVWSEIPIYWRVAFDNPQVLAKARTMLAENIERDRNRASIIIWSVANETPVSAPRTDFLETLADDAHRLDPTRLVSAALLNDRTTTNGHAEMVLNDPLVSHVDVLAINTYNGWYTADKLADVPNITWRVPADKPLVFSELGADALAGFHDPATMRKESEEYQAAFFRQTLQMADRIPTLVGMSPWVLKDFRSPRRQHPVFESGWNRKGLISPTGQRKQAFQVLADYYAKKASDAASIK
ncbi:glycoside hydrolase family 2 protein [Sphingomonas crusticola]|uniref:glycoside hydrolase family 2 protein n=1 Tax=Sphingomonas crusticola TaxID=1697973 RepID=UPI000E230276|nr:glycoside hydrolase family 2 TIM barrel-domain containing protein [Sphingomonas crusticola]